MFASFPRCSPATFGSPKVPFTTLLIKGKYVKFDNCYLEVLQFLRGMLTMFAKIATFQRNDRVSAFHLPLCVIGAIVIASCGGISNIRPNTDKSLSSMDSRRDESLVSLTAASTSNAIAANSTESISWRKEREMRHGEPNDAPSVLSSSEASRNLLVRSDKKDEPWLISSDETLNDRHGVVLESERASPAAGGLKASIRRVGLFLSSVFTKGQ